VNTFSACFLYARVYPACLFIYICSYSGLLATAGSSVVGEAAGFAAAGGKTRSLTNACEAPQALRSQAKRDLNSYRYLYRNQ